MTYWSRRAFLRSVSAIPSRDAAPCTEVNAGHDIDGNIGRLAGRDLLGRASENQWIAALEANDALALLRQAHHQAVDVLLRTGRPEAGLPTSIFLASRRAKSITSRDTRSSNKITSADCSARARHAMSAIPGRPVRRRPKSPMPLSTAAPGPFTSGNEAVEIGLDRLAVGIGDRISGKNLPELAPSRERQPGKLQRTAPAPRQQPAQSANPFGSSASSLARIAWAKTGAAPSVEIPMTSGERLTMAPKENRRYAGLSITLTGTPAARAAAANVAAPSSLSKAPIAIAERLQVLGLAKGAR